MRSLASRPGLRRILSAIAAVLVVAAAIAAFLILHSPGNISHPDVSFTRPTATPTPPKTSTPAAVENFVWAGYGFDQARTHFFDAPAALEPPFHVGWKFNDKALLEFPPAIDGNSLFVVDDNGYARRIDARTGHVQWIDRIGTLAAASPGIAVRQHIVVMVVLSTDSHAPGNGRAVGLSMRSGHVLWSHPLAAGSESSPLVWGNSVYFGDQSGTVYSLNVRNGHVNWEYHAKAAVKGAIAKSGNHLYFGDYAGRAYALHAANGRPIWAVSTDGSAFGFGSGSFYSTAAVAFGRVYLGNTDGFVYSFAQGSGQLAWRQGTGAYVYASPAVADVKGLGPTVYIGSYNSTFYALNAQSGAVRWSHPAGGRISGSATIIGNTVYYSDLGTKTTTGLDARTGHTVFTFGDGAFNPMVADDNALFMDGYGEMYQLLPNAPVHHSSRSKSSSPKAKPTPTPNRRIPAHPSHKPSGRSTPHKRPPKPKRSSHHVASKSHHGHHR